MKTLFIYLLGNPKVKSLSKFTEGLHNTWQTKVTNPGHVMLDIIRAASAAWVLGYRCPRADWRCSGWTSAAPDSPCSRSSSSFLPRRTSAAPLPAAVTWYPERRRGAVTAMGQAGVYFRCSGKCHNRIEERIPVLLVYKFKETSKLTCVIPPPGVETL